jgi:hypothetical protein
MPGTTRLSSSYWFGPFSVIQSADVAGSKAIPKQLRTP